ncbi:SURF1 family cytochrome oxidase biogenesis protein [Streptomyces sp. PTD5-9]|uniref:SURF1 family cytochrome oxidase biogenesis protein n=1 Tax=Streptomyces sp. PTD5-9 TaxID=3120150 RepID=UPI00300B9D94
MYRFLLTRQWLLLALLVLVLIPTMVELGFWQLHRHEHRVAQNALISRNLRADPVPVASLTSPGHTVPRSDYWRTVSATGVYDTAHEVVVRRRTSNDDRVGVHVLTPFDLKGGGTVLVDRGWVPSAESQRAFPRVPPPPSGEVTVTGRLKADETTGSSGIKDISDLPDRQVMLINSGQESERLSRPVFGGYIEQTAPEPSGGSPELIAAPDDGSIGPHMAYAVQWWLFAAAVPVGYVVLARREKRDREQAAAAETAEEPSAAEPERPEPAPA